MNMLPKVSVLMAAYNEESRIGDTIKTLRMIPAIKEIIVVDDGSRDATWQKALEAGCKVIKLPVNSGKGAALNAGAASVTGQVVLLIDADLGASAREAEKLIEPVVNKEADLTIAKFPPSRGKGGFGLVKKLAAWGVYLYSGTTCDSVLSGQRAMTLEVFKKLLPFTPGYSVEVAATIKSAKLGIKILEIPVEMSHRVTGRDFPGFCHRGRQFWHIFLFLLSKAGTRC